MIVAPPSDQIVQRFGTDMVAEVTGRSRRIVRKMLDHFPVYP
jgi:hypothetical protein